MHIVDYIEQLKIANTMVARRHRIMQMTNTDRTVEDWRQLDELRAWFKEMGITHS